ncbi:MAG: tRNA(Ile)-lysidine synthetase, partial [Proteobacteria bacterium]|nr:tRNA(Ile)-lysidine synthetase [Pseudomonadota bacterium]
MLAKALREALKSLSPGARIFIAYSGGIDSQVLLHVASQWALQEGVQLTALHLNHGLSPNADEWQNLCQQ